MLRAKVQPSFPDVSFKGAKRRRDKYGFMLWEMLVSVRDALAMIFALKDEGDAYFYGLQLKCLIL